MSEEQPWLLQRIVAIVSEGAADKRGSSWASASLISPTLAITARHVIQNVETRQSDQKKVLLDFPEGPGEFSVPATVISEDADFDFAVLKLDRAVPWELPSPLLTQQIPGTGA